MLHKNMSSKVLYNKIIFRELLPLSKQISLQFKVYNKYLDDTFTKWNDIYS